MPETYTKKDYLTALQYSKKIGENVEIVKKAMHLAELKQATIRVKTTKRQIVTPIGENHTKHLRPEPEAHELLNEYIAQIKAKGVTK